MRRRFGRVFGMAMGAATLLGILFAASGPVASAASSDTFVLTAPATSTAGTSFTVTLKAEKSPGHTDASYMGTHTINWSGAANAPNGTAPLYPTSTVTFNSGVATTTLSATFYGAGSNSLTATDQATPSTTGSTSITINPAPATHFRVPTPSQQTAGAAFTETITALDPYDNTDTNYAGVKTVTFSGPHNSPSNTPPSYPTSVTFLAGVAMPSITLFDAETTTLTATSGTLSGTTPASFTIVPATPATLTFTPPDGQQPTETCVLNSSTCGTSSLINNPTGVRVQAKDAYSNLAYNTSVKVAIDPLSDPSGGTATLGGTTTQATDATGVATFADLTIDTIGVGYKLRATAPAPPTSPTASPQSSTAFTIAQSVTPCHGSSCAGTASQSKNTVSVTGTGIDGTTLGIALIDGATPPLGVCGSPSGSLWTPDPGTTGTYVDVNGAGTPTLTVTWRLDKTVVQTFPQNGASHYDVCLGAVYLADPGNGTLTGFPTKFAGVNATPKHDDTFNVYFYWGVLPDCPKTLTSLTNPCVISRNKTNAGDEIIKYFVANGWDATGHLGGT